MPIHFASNDAKQRLAVDQHFHTILLDDLVEHARLVYVFKMVRQPRTATVLDAHSNEFRLRLR